MGRQVDIRGDLNDIKYQKENKRERIRPEASYKSFREFIEQMDMEEIRFFGKEWTWTNNWEDAGYIEVRLDGFFGSGQWLFEHVNAVVRHIEKQASDHYLLVLDTKPEQKRKQARFYFDKRWVKKPSIEDIIRLS